MGNWWAINRELIVGIVGVIGTLLTIQGTEGIVILSATIIYAVNDLNKIGVTVNRERTQATITFDYLDRNQGGVIQVFHTGTEKDDLSFKGTIMGPTPIKGRPASAG